MDRYKSRVLLDQDALRQGIDALAERLGPELTPEMVTVVPILGGAMVFAADLMRRLPPGLVLDFMRIGTYGDATSPQNAPKADWLPHEENIRGRHVLLVDDILDTGRTMTEARRHLIEDFGAAKVTVVVLIDKPLRRDAPVQADHRVLLLEEDLFLVGYGLDLAGRYRNLPELLALEPKTVALAQKSDEEIPAATPTQNSQASS